MEKKRPVNIIDIVIIIAIIAIIAGPLVRAYLEDKFYYAKNTTEIEISAVIPKQDKLLFERISVGDKIYFAENGKLCGEIVLASFKDSSVFVTDDNGERVYTSNPQFYDISLTISAIAKVDNSGTFINGDVFISPGSELNIYTSTYEFTLNIGDIILKNGSNAV